MRKIKGSDIFTIIVMLIMGLAMLQAMKMPFLAAAYPIFVCNVVILICIVSLVRSLWGRTSVGGVIDVGIDDNEPASVKIKKATKGFVWVLVLYFLSALLGFKLGALVFIAGFVGIEGRARWFLILALTAGTLAILIAFQNILNVYWPLGLLGQWLAEPFPWMF